MANLITLEDYKTAKGITGTTEDAKITPLLASVSQLVRTYCGQAFTDYFAADKTEYFDINWPAEFVQLDEGPVTSVTNVYERPDISSAYVTLTSTEYYLDTKTDSIWRVNTEGNGYQEFYEGPAAVKVVYRAGYSACPADLKLAVVDLITYYLKEEHKPNRTLGSANLQNQGTSSQPASANFPDHIKRILDLYRTR